MAPHVMLTVIAATKQLSQTAETEPYLWALAVAGLAGLVIGYLAVWLFMRQTRRLTEEQAQSLLVLAKREAAVREERGAVEDERLVLAALAAHRTQQDWLDVSQGMNSYLRTMEDTSRAVGKMSRRFPHAEGWRRHSHLGFCEEQANPLRHALEKQCAVNRTYEREF